MDLLDYNNMKAQKASFTHFRSITKLLRFLELCVALLLLLWIFNRLPFAVKISGDFIRWLAGVVASPPFVFLLCNVIIATLFAKSGRFSADNRGDDNADTELYDELMKNTPKPLPDVPVVTDEVVYQDKEIILSQEPTAIVHTREDQEIDSDSASSDSDSDADNRRVYRRTKSEKLERENAKVKQKKKKILRRSETEKPARSDGENLCPEDDLSDEEFQRAIDEFIAKHMMFRRQESLAFVHSQSFVPEIQQK